MNTLRSGPTRERQATSATLDASTMAVSRHRSRFPGLDALSNVGCTAVPQGWGIAGGQETTGLTLSGRFVIEVNSLDAPELPVRLSKSRPRPNGNPWE